MQFSDLQHFLKSFQAFHNEKFGNNSSEDVDLLMNMTKITEEVGELAEQVMKYQGRQRNAKGEFNLSDLEDEIADVIIATSMIWVALDIDLNGALGAKIEKIKKKRWM